MENSSKQKYSRDNNCAFNIYSSKCTFIRAIFFHIAVTKYTEYIELDKCIGKPLIPSMF
jgi:hypothetical protein